MSGTRENTQNVQEIWDKLNSRWQGEAADAFHREYIARITEAVETFEAACSELANISAELSKELQMIEQSMANS